MAKLFSPITFKNIELKNRIVMSPMCMYSCVDHDGKVTPFHITHYASRAIGQVGLIITEAAAVMPEGRISMADLGIWDDEHIKGLKELNKQVHQYNSKTAIQLAHAGRKALINSDIYAPSAIPFNNSHKTPLKLSKDQIKETIQSFKRSAIRAKEADFDIIEIHAAHGYLINEFLSPLTNKRTDHYGGSKESRYRFLEEVISEVKSIWQGPLFVRISTDEYNQDGNTVEDILYYSKRMKEQGVDLIDASSGGIVPAEIRTYPGYQVSRCDLIKQTLNIKTGAVGLITSGIQAEEILQNSRADLIFIGRPLLKNPYLPNVFANELNYKLTPPKQYKRGWN